jgi:hypothetical protein
MSPMSLLTLSGETLQASHDNGDGPSPHGERGERYLASWMGLGVLLMSATLMLLVRLH